MNKKTLIRVIVFLLLVIVLDRSIGSVLKRLYFNQKNSQSHSLNYTIKECRSDIIIFGNSRAQHHYIPKLLADSLKMSCYNAGIDGGHSILLSQAEIKLVTERYTPKIIILELYPEGITDYEKVYDRLAVLLPFYKDYPSIQPIVKLKSTFEEQKLISEIYPYNSILINTIVFNTNLHAARKKDYDGFIPLEGSINSSGIINVPSAPAEMKVDSNMVNALNDIITICKQKNIKLFIINSPVFHQKGEKPKNSSASELFHKIIKNNRVFFKDFEFDSTFYNRPDMFKDRGHLNEKGSLIFSSMVAKMINDNRLTLNE